MKIYSKTLILNLIMLDTSDEFEFEFEKVICTDLLLRGHNNW